MSTDDKQWTSQGMRKPREDCNVPVDFAIKGRIYMGLIKNKSDTGVFVEAMESFSPGQDLVLTFTFPGDRKPIKSKGKIVRTDNKGFGMQFQF